MQYFDIILFAVIAGVLAIRLYRILGIKSKVIIKKNEDSVQNVVNLNKEKIKEEDKKSDNIETENGEGLQHLKNIQLYIFKMLQAFSIFCLYIVTFLILFFNFLFI